MSVVGSVLVTALLNESYHSLVIISDNFEMIKLTPSTLKQFGHRNNGVFHSCACVLVNLKLFYLYFSR